MEMNAVTYDGTVVQVTFDLIVRRTVMLETRVHGNMSIDGVMYVSMRDTGSFWADTFSSDEYMARFFPAYTYLSYNSLAILRTGVMLNHNRSRFDAFMIAHFCTLPLEGQVQEATIYFAPAETIEEIEHIKKIVEWHVYGFRF